MFNLNFPNSIHSVSQAVQYIQLKVKTVQQTLEYVKYGPVHDIHGCTVLTGL